MSKEFVPFKEDTKNGLIACAKWLESHAEELSEQFYGGCRDWSIEFSSGEDGIFHNIAIHVNKISKEVCEAYMDSIVEYEKAEEGVECQTILSLR